MTYDEWIETYKPQQNHIDKGASTDGTMFETFGEEMDFVLTQDNRQVWTLVEGDEGMYVLAGTHLVNRMGFFVTEVPWTYWHTEIKVE